jgi:hypothetical protein
MKVFPFRMEEQHGFSVSSATKGLKVTLICRYKVKSCGKETTGKSTDFSDRVTNENNDERSRFDGLYSRINLSNSELRLALNAPHQLRQVIMFVFAVELGSPYLLAPFTTRHCF